MSLCPGCARRPQLHDIGLCGECQEQRLIEKAESPPTPEDQLDWFKALIVHVVDSLRRPEKATTLRAFLDGKAAIIVSIRGVTIDWLEPPPKVDGVLRRESLN